MKNKKRSVVRSVKTIRLPLPCTTDIIIYAIQNVYHRHEI